MSEVQKEIVIYLVDDDRGMVSATSQWLSLSGKKVRAFADPTALMKVLKPREPCVIISDVRMPDVNGIELMKLVRARDKRIPVILITGHGDIPLAVEAMKLGAFEFLSKPFSPERLLEIVEQAQKSVSTEKVSTGLEKTQKNQFSKKSDCKVDSSTPGSQTLSSLVEAYEKEVIETALKRHRGVIPNVLQELDIPRRTLNAKMKKHGIIRSKYR